MRDRSVRAARAIALRAGGVRVGSSAAFDWTSASSSAVDGFDTVAASAVVAAGEGAGGAGEDGAGGTNRAVDASGPGAMGSATLFGNATAATAIKAAMQG